MTTGRGGIQLLPINKNVHQNKGKRKKEFKRERERGRETDRQKGPRDVSSETLTLSVHPPFVQNWKRKKDPQIIHYPCLFLAQLVCFHEANKNTMIRTNTNEKPWACFPGIDNRWASLTGKKAPSYLTNAGTVQRTNLEKHLRMGDNSDCAERVWALLSL